MEPHETVQFRCAEIGLDDAHAGDVEATIFRKRAGRGPSVSSEASSPTLRELPKISVDLRLPEEVTMPSGRVERDLEVLSMLGEGGMGRVLLARQHSLDREVAIKTLHATASPRDRVSLIQEGAITGHLEHPSIVPVHALGLDGNGNPVMVMKRVEGVEWSALLRNPEHEAWGEDRRDRMEAHLDILMQVCNAVHFAHSRGIVHRDIKPANVLIGRYGEVYLCDWGIAIRPDSDAQTEPICGTPAYMAPEMIIGEPVDARTDVYLLGATLHVILTGKPRNAGLKLHETLVGAVEPAPFAYAPSVPEELVALCRRATAFDRAERLPTAMAMRQAIADYRHHKSSIALAQSAQERLARVRTLVQDSASRGNPDIQRDIDLLGAEARFALEQALREWSDNAVAQAASKELRELFDERRARAAELERLARELDPRVGTLGRTVFFGGLALIGIVLSIIGSMSPESITPRQLFYQGLAPVGALAFLTIIMWRSIQRTTFTRRVALSGWAVLIGITFSRVAGVVGGMSTAQILTYDMLLSALIAAICAVTMLRWLAWFAILLLVGAGWALLVPKQAMIAFWIVTNVTLVAGAIFSYRGRGVAE